MCNRAYRCTTFSAFFFALVPLATLVAGPQQSDRIHLSLDAAEAEQVLAILAVRQAGKAVEDSQWATLFSTEPYQRLKKREASIAERYHIPSLAFTDEDFKKFVLSENLLKKAPELQGTLDRWKKADLYHSAERVLAYLPQTAVLRAKVYPMIKPRENSFVFEASTDPAIMLYLDPEVTAAKFENTVAHELHHIGIGSVQTDYDKKIATLSKEARPAATWMGAFAEGEAMLAAAGGPDVDPHAASTAKEHALWDHDMANFNDDLRSVNAFFLDMVTGRLASEDSIEQKGGNFYGRQGPWYTVGYKMAMMVEKRFSRDSLIEAMLDPRRLLLLYNMAAAEQNAMSSNQLPLWSKEVLKQVGAE